MKGKLQSEGETLVDFVLAPVLQSQKVLLGERLIGLVLHEIHIRMPPYNESDANNYTLKWYIMQACCHVL